MNADPIRAIADAVLYEGYILWPYRRSALKNQRRFTFGGVYPPAHSAAHPDDPATMQTEVLLWGEPDASVQVSVRFLHVVQRSVARRCGGALEPVDELIVDGERYLAWDEAVERECHPPQLTLERLKAGCVVPIAVAAGQEEEALVDQAGVSPGALIRTWRALQGELRLLAVPVTEEAWRVSATITNTTASPPGSRQQALEQTFCSTHTLLCAPQARFTLSQPRHVAGAGRRGRGPQHHAVLADHPRGPSPRRPAEPG
jgi:hypothetical protein